MRAVATVVAVAACRGDSVRQTKCGGDLRWGSVGGERHHHNLCRQPEYTVLSADNLGYRV
jgi:hypothetical protein